MIGWPDIQLAVRASVAAIASLFVAQWLGLQYPIYAFIAAVIVMDLSPRVSQRLGLRRLAATLVGAFCGASLSFLVPHGPIGVGVGFLLAMLVAQILGTGEGARVAGYISGIVLLEHSAEPWNYAFHRLVETALGVLFAWAISFLPKLITGGEKADGRT